VAGGTLAGFRAKCFSWKIDCSEASDFTVFTIPLQTCGGLRIILDKAVSHLGPNIKHTIANYVVIFGTTEVVNHYIITTDERFV
jgi:hypothetical protein